MGCQYDNSFITGYAYGATLTNATMFATMDRLGSAQYLTRVGLLLDGNQGSSLDQAKQDWLEHAAWQPLRQSVENMLILQDWYELFVAQNLVFDGYLYPLIKHIVDREFVAHGASAVSLLTSFMNEWFDETQPWVNAVIKTTAAESEHNREQILQWIEKWQAQVRPVVAELLQLVAAQPEDVALIEEVFTQRLRKIGLIAKESAA